MRTKKSLITLMLMVMLFVFGVPASQYKVQAISTGSLINVMKAPKASAGRWVNTTKGLRYQFTSTGEYAKQRWLYVDGKLYYFTIAGYTKVGMMNYNCRNYLFGKKGVLKTGWRTYQGNRYYFWKSSYRGAESGSAAVGKVTIAGETYFFDKDGIQRTGWHKVGSYYYYFYKDTGKMAVSTTIGKYQVDASGRRIVKDAKGTVDYWVGDSRTVGLGSAVGISSKCIAKVGEGYTWYVSYAESQLISKLNSNPYATVVFNLGVNDIDNYKWYIAKYNTLMKKYPYASFYFMSINPVDFTKYSSPWLTDKQIQTFNNALKASFPNQYIDCYSYLKPYIVKKGAYYSSNNTDSMGLHYTTTIYKKIYEFVRSKV